MSQEHLKEVCGLLKFTEKNTFFADWLSFWEAYLQGNDAVLKNP